MSDWLKKGVVIRQFFEEMVDKEKFKRGVVVGQTTDRDQLLFVFIGTKMFKDAKWNIPLNNTEYDFLDHVSNLYCGRVTPVSYNKISKRVQENPKIVVGNLSPRHLNDALHRIEACPSVETKYKKIIRLNIPKPLIVEYK